MHAARARWPGTHTFLSPSPPLDHCSYWVTVFTIEHIGRWKIQLIGFLLMGLCLSLLAGAHAQLMANTAAFVALYALTFFFANWVRGHAATRARGGTAGTRMRTINV